MGVSNKDDTDWLNFFKETPKNTKEPLVTKSASEDKPKAGNARSVVNRRRSSGADWLGLSESDLAEKEVDIKAAGDWEPKIARPQTTPNVSNRKKSLVDPDLGWLKDNRTISSSPKSKKDLDNSLLPEKEQLRNDKIVHGGDRVYSQHTIDETVGIEKLIETPRVQGKSLPRANVPTQFSLQSTPVDLESQATTKVSSKVSMDAGFSNEIGSLQPGIYSQNAAGSLQPDVSIFYV